MLFFVYVFIYLLFYRCDGRATIFKFKLNYFYVQILTYSDPSLYRASPIAASLLRGIFYSAFFSAFSRKKRYSAAESRRRGAAGGTVKYASDNVSYLVFIAI